MAECRRRAAVAHRYGDGMTQRPFVSGMCRGCRGQEASWDASRRDNAQASPLLGHTRGHNIQLWPRTQHEDPFLGMIATTEARGIMRSYLKIVVLIAGLVGAYLALLPLIV